MPTEKAIKMHHTDVTLCCIRMTESESVIKAFLHFSDSSVAEPVINYRYSDRSKLGCSGTSQTQQTGKENLCDDVRTSIDV